MMADFTVDPPSPGLLKSQNEARPASVFTELSSEPDRLFIAEDTAEPQNVLHVDILTSPGPLTTSHTVDGVVESSTSYKHMSDPWGYTNGSQTQSTAQLFRPFLPIATPQGETSIAAAQPRYTGPYSYHTPQVLNLTPQHQTLDAEVSFYSWLSGDTTDTDSYYNPGSHRSIMTPSSVSTSTSNSETPTELDVLDFEPADVNSDTGANETIQETLRRRIHGKAKKVVKAGNQRETARSSFPYKRHPKPPYTYCGLIVTAIMLSPQKRLTLAGVHSKLRKLFPFFRGDYTGWRHSVRHNMSHNDCFVKAGLADGDENEKRNSYYWRVDPSKIPIGSFCVQRNAEFKSGAYSDHIYDQLGLPKSLYDCDLASLCRCRTFDGTSRTPQTSATVTRVNLPHVTDCALPTESPEAYRSRDLIGNSSFNTSFGEASRNQSTSPLTSAGSGQLQASGGLMGYNRISQYIMSTDGSEWTSNAVENLSFLCNSTM